MEHQPVETTLYSLAATAPGRPDRRSSERYLSLLRVGAIEIAGPPGALPDPEHLGRRNDDPGLFQNRCRDTAFGRAQARRPGRGRRSMGRGRSHRSRVRRADRRRRPARIHRGRAAPAPAADRNQLHGAGARGRRHGSSQGHQHLAGRNLRRAAKPIDPGRGRGRVAPRARAGGRSGEMVHRKRLRDRVQPRAAASRSWSRGSRISSSKNSAGPAPPDYSPRAPIGEAVIHRSSIFRS